MKVSHLPNRGRQTVRKCGWFVGHRGEKRSERQCVRPDEVLQMRSRGAGASRGERVCLSKRFPIGMQDHGWWSGQGSKKGQWFGGSLQMGEFGMKEAYGGLAIFNRCPGWHPSFGALGGSLSGLRTRPFEKGSRFACLSRELQRLSTPL